MAFKEYRNPCKKSVTHEFSIERFAHDVFAYMLRICRFPEEKIPTSSLKENIYMEDDFVRNVGLSALPIALYKRDEWRFTFEAIFGESGIHNIQEIQNYLESYIVYSGELDEEDTLSKIQFSLALCNEYMLFLNFKNIESYFDSLTKLWSHLCKELIEQSEEFDQSLESSLTMCPDVSESWISNFITNFASPYGRSDDVSDKFSVHTLECHDPFPLETPTDCVPNAVPEETIFQPSDVLTEGKIMSLPDSSNLELNFNPNTLFPPDSSEENNLVETRTCGKRTNGLSYVLNQCLKGRKRSRSQKLEVEDAFGNLNLEKENVSPNNRDTKRRRQKSGNGSHE